MDRMRKLLLVMIVVSAGVISFLLARAKPDVDNQRRQLQGTPAPASPADLILGREPEPPIKFVVVTDREGRPREITGTRWDMDISGYRAGDGDFRIRASFEWESEEQYRFVEWDSSRLCIGIVEAGIRRDVASIAAGKRTAGDEMPWKGAYTPGELVRISRRKNILAVQSGGCVALSLLLPPPAAGKAGYAVLRGDASPKVEFSERSPILVGDDFMREGEGEETWQLARGEESSWRTSNLRNPLLSANAFYYLGRGKDAISVMGAEWWSQYRYRCSLRGPERGAAGIVFAYKDPSNFVLFRWSPKGASQKEDGAAGGQIAGIGGTKGSRELILFRDGRQELLASSEGGFTPDMWYEVEARVFYGRVSVRIDGHEVLAASDPRLAGGGIGVYADVPPPEKEAADPKRQEAKINSLDALMRQHVVVDDVRIEDIEEIEDRFLGAADLRERGWDVLGGPWLIGAGGKRGLACGVAGGGWKGGGGGPSRAIIGDPSWNALEVSVEATIGEGKSGGLVQLYRDESSFYTAEVCRDDRKGAGLVLKRWQDGRPSAEDSAPFSPGPEGQVKIGASLRRGHLKAWAEAAGGGGKAVVETLIRGGRVSGRVGIQAEPRGGEVRFERFRIEFPEEKEPLITTNAIFGDEESMRSWTNPSSEWWPPKEPYFVDGEPVDLLWHRAQFPGDVELVLETREILREKFEAALSVSKTGQGKNNGYVLKASFTCAPGGQARWQTQSGELALIRAGEEVCRETIASADFPDVSTVALRRCGRYLVGMINGRPALVYRDNNPQDGTKIAYYTRGVLVKAEATKIYSNHFFDYEFNRAPTDWRPGRLTVAEVTNRWQCDPRWSFFSLRPLDYPMYQSGIRNRLAVLWNKRKFSGDVTVEFFAGIKMTGERGGKYEYARDINVTICSDGKNLNKGYSFMFGGMGNKGSYILRDGVEVAAFGGGVPVRTTNFHRHWFYVRAEKRGKRLSFRVDKFFAGAPGGELAFEDERPLEGDRLAIWTYDCGIMISRVRISGEGGQEIESPDFEAPAEIPCPCDGN